MTEKFSPNFLKGRISITLFGVALLIVLAVLGFSIFKTKKSANTIIGQPQVFYNIDTSRELIMPSESQIAKDLPQELIIEPGIYKVFGSSYNLQKEGVYRFILPNKANEQRIVYKNNPHALLSGIAWLFVHGDRDNGEKNSKLMQKATQEKLVATCGKITSFAKSILSEKKIESRIVSALTNDPLNGFDDSHVLIEVKFSDGWRVYDLDNNNVFKKQGRYLNLIELKEAFANNSFELEKIADDPVIDATDFKASGYDFGFYTEQKLANDSLLKEWYKRIFGTVFVEQGNVYYYYDGFDEIKIKSFYPNSKKVEQKEFKSKFYD